MKRLVILAAVAALGVFTAIAVAASGASQVCATTPAHTVAVDGSPVSTTPGDIECASVPTVTVTVTDPATTATGPPATTTTASGSNPYESAISYTQTRPAFTATRTINVATAAALKSAISNLRPGDLVKATANFTVSGETVIKNRLSAPAELDLSGVSFVYSGGQELPAVWLDNAANLYIYGGDMSTANTGAGGILDYGSQHVLWWGFTIHNTGGGGIGIMPVNGPVDHDDFQGTIWSVGHNLAWDPHTEKGTGLHGALLDDVSNSNAFTNNRIALDEHDIPVGACVQAGNSTTPTAAGGNILYLRCVNETEVATVQTGGNGIQFWGHTSNLGMDIEYLEVDNAQGQALHASLSSGQTLHGVTVEYGRASNVNQNKAMSDNTQPWNTTSGVTYQDVQPAP